MRDNRKFIGLTDIEALYKTLLNQITQHNTQIEVSFSGKSSSLLDFYLQMGNIVWKCLFVQLCK